MHDRLFGVELIDSMVDIGQSPIDRTQRSNPAACSKVLDPARELFPNRGD